MANNKFVVKNGLQTNNIDLVSPDRANTISIDMLNSDTLSVSGNSGQLFSITDSLTGTIFAVNDISGVPSIEVDDDGEIRFAETFGNVLIGTAIDDGSKLQVNGNATIAGTLAITGNVTVTGTIDGRDVSVDGAKLDGIAAGAEVNQNAFSNVVVSGQTTVAADSKTDTLTLIAGTNVTITTDANTDSITISSTDTNTTYSAGNGLILTGTTFAVGTPSTLTTSTTNSTTTTSHTHAVTFPVTSVNAKTGGVTLTSTDVGAIPTTEKGVANGVATLDSSGLIPSSQLPSYVDDVLEFTNLASFPSTGESGKIYVALDTNKTYRWSGSAYVYITSGAVDSVNAGNAITVSSTTGVVTVNHADTSSQASVNNSGNTFIQDITLDTYGHITGIASATVAIGDGTLTVNTSGTGLSGSGTFTANQSTNNTITITSNATSANTASTVVARDASGNFSAGTITASLNGNATGVVRTVTGANTAELVRGNMADNDQFRILVGGSTSNGGYAEIATADDGNEPIYVRQYTGVFATLTRTATLLDSSGNTSFPGTVTAPTFSGALSGNASTATKLATARTISLTGDVTGSVSFDGSADASITATIAANSVELGTDTTGNYVASVATTAPISGGAAGSEGTAITLSLADGYGDTKNPYASKTANYFLAAPNGSAGVPLFRAMVAADVPNLTLEKLPDAWAKRSVRVATTANITLSGAQTIDGVAVVAGDRVLVKNQSTASQNGIYVVAAGAWSRSADADTSVEIAGAVVAVDAGTANGGLHFDTDFKTTDTIGTAAMTWHRVVDTALAVTSGSTAVDGYIRYNGTTAAAGQFDGGTTTPTGTTRLNYGGYFYPTFVNLTGSSDTATAASHYFVETGSDGFVRPKTLANVRSEICTTVSDDTTTNATYYPTFATATSGAMTAVKVSSTKLTFNPSTGTLLSTDYNSISDASKKTNIKTVASDIVYQLRGVEFEWINTNKQSSGVIAQEVEDVIPHAVSTDEEGFKSVNYNSLIAYLIEAIKEQQKQIDELKILIAK